MSYQEKFEFTSNNAKYFSKQFDILITGFDAKDNERHYNFKKMLNGFKGIIYSLDTCENAEKLNYKISNHDGEIIDESFNKSLIPELQNLLVKNRLNATNICIDITNLKQGVLFLLIRLLITEIKPARLFAAYTEPLGYKKRDIPIIGETEEFDLYERIIGTTSGVPGFIKHQSSKSIMLIATLGFDCQRLQTIYENLKPKRIIPIVGFPSFIPGWDLTAIKMNYMVLKNAECFNMVKTCEASSPFEIYNIINKYFQRNNSEYDIYIAPLGTRPHCLGSALFASRNSSVYLVYDFPVEKEYRSEGILKTNIYHLSRFIGI